MVRQGMTDADSIEWDKQDAQEAIRYLRNMDAEIAKICEILGGSVHDLKADCMGIVAAQAMESRTHTVIAAIEQRFGIKGAR